MLVLECGFDQLLTVATVATEGLRPTKGVCFLLDVNEHFGYGTPQQEIPPSVDWTML